MRYASYCYCKAVLQSTSNPYQSFAILITMISDHFYPVNDDYRVPFHLAGIPVTNHFVSRDAEMKKIEESLAPRKAHERRQIYILYGLGGIGKTQMAIAYARKHHEIYNAILWLNGNSKDTLLQSLAAFGKHAKISGLSESTAGMAPSAQDMEMEAKVVIRWLALRENRRWLMIVDNVDREYGRGTNDPQAYDITFFLPPTDHGSVLITTRLPSLGEIGNSTCIQRLDLQQALELLSDRSSLARTTHGMKCPHNGFKNYVITN